MILHDSNWKNNQQQHNEWVIVRLPPFFVLVICTNIGSCLHHHTSEFK